MEFGYLGVRHVETPLAVRELVSFTDSKKTDFFETIRRIGVRQCMVLSTCNRSEIFFFYPTEKSPVCGTGETILEQARSCYTSSFPDTDVTEYLQEKQGEDALIYLFRVAAGLESLVLGEDQILGQVVDALDFSQTMGMAGKELNKVVRDAIRCAKRIKEELRISEKPLSVSYVGVRHLADAVEGGLADRILLVIGSGKTAELALMYLREYGPEKIYVCNRSMRRAGGLKERFPEVTLISYEDRYSVMAECDVVVSATASPHLVVAQGDYLTHLSGTESKKRYFLDLAAPRDIDERLGMQPEIQIIDLDTLQRITRDNCRERERLAKESKTMIREAVEELREWFYVSRMDGTIESLQRRCHDITEDSFGYLNRKLDLTGREQRLVRKVLNASLQRLLREPIRELKLLETEEEQEEYKEMIHRLFQTERE